MADVTVLRLNTSDVSNVFVRNNDTTILMSAPATVNVETIRFSDATPSVIARTTTSGDSSFASRADHSHSGATLLLDGGNY